MIKYLFILIDWYSFYSFIFITVFLLLSFRVVQSLKKKKLNRDAKWLRNGLFIILAFDILFYIIPRLLLNIIT